MARKIRAKLIMELREQGLSRRMIAKTRRMSMESVCGVFDIAAERNIGWGDVREMADDEVYRLFYPERHVRESAFEEPDWEYVHKEMARVGVNLRLLHDEYRERCRRTRSSADGRSRAGRSRPGTPRAPRRWRLRSGLRTSTTPRSSAPWAAARGSAGGQCAAAPPAGTRGRRRRDRVARSADFAVALTRRRRRGPSGTRPHG